MCWCGDDNSKLIFDYEGKIEFENEFQTSHVHIALQLSPRLFLTSSQEGLNNENWLTSTSNVVCCTTARWAISESDIERY